MSKRKTRRVSGRLIAIVAALAGVSGALAFWFWPRTPSTPPPSPTVVVSSLTDTGGVTLPKKLGSLRFAVMGDTGRGDRAQYDTANEMARWHDKFEFSFVLMLGDNIYAENGSHEEYVARFERPYKALFDKGVKFYASLGNHDPPGQTDYVPFNMNGNRYYNLRKEAPLPVGGHKVDFFALDTVTLDQPQVAWLTRLLAASDADWKICFFHHPVYTSGRYRLSAFQLRRRLEPIFVSYGVDVVFSGHEHFYERIAPQRGVLYFTSGGGGALRRGDIRRSELTAAGYDQDTHFMLIEISGDTLYFQTISRTGQTVDQGQFDRVKHPAPPPVLRP